MDELLNRKPLRLADHDYSQNGLYFVTVCTKDRKCLLSSITPTISRIVKQLKGSILKQCGTAIWQRSYYDHVIRNDKEYLKIWKYIDENPIKWTMDEYYTE